MAISGTFTATGQSGAITLSNRIPFNVSIWGTFVATVAIERSFDAGSTWVGVSRDNLGTAATFTAPMSLTINECEPGVLWRLNCTAYTSGTVNYRLSQ